MPPALQASDLHKSYGSTQALKGVSLEVGEGELVGLLGPNGAGKSTLVKIACGLVTATAGTAQIAGAPAGSPEAHRALGYLAELFRFPDWLSADELLGMHQRLAGSDGGAAERERAARRRRAARGGGHAASARCRRACSSGSGSRRRWSAARGCCCSTSRRARSTRPGGGPCGGCSRTCARDGVAVLLNSHLLSEVELVCDHVAIIARGELVAGGHAERAQPRRWGGGRDGERDATVPGRHAGRRRRGIVRDLVAAGEDVYEVRILRSTLEDTYLEAVGES